MKKLNKEEGVTILMVTHDSMIASYAKRLLFIMDGKIAQVLDRGDMKQKSFIIRLWKSLHMKQWNY